MERFDAMSLSGSGSYYIQRGMTSGPGQQSGLQGSQGHQQMSNQNMQFQSNVGGGSSMDSLQIESISTCSTHDVNVSPPSTTPRKKRGRPRKYGPDRGVSLGLTKSLSLTKLTTTSASEQKRGRGRPPGSGKKHQIATFGGSITSSTGTGFTPHVITIAIGEDITSKIMLFSQQSPRAVCILSANGSVSTVTLAQPASSGGTLTYEGRFEIICLSGCYLLTDDDASRNRGGGLSVSLASPDGRVFGGGVGGMLIAATPVQVIVGCFEWGNSKTKKTSSPEAQEDTMDSERHGADNTVTPGNIHSTQSLMPNSSMGGWPHIRPIDMRDGHTDIDLMRE